MSKDSVLLSLGAEIIRVSTGVVTPDNVFVLHIHDHDPSFPMWRAVDSRRQGRNLSWERRVDCLPPAVQR